MVTEPVPWVDRPAPAPSSTDTTPPRALYTACAAHQLNVSTGPLAEDGERFIKLTNDSDRSCTLVGMPQRATGVRSDGSELPIDTTPTDALIDVPANLGPGYSAFVIIGSRTSCARRSRASLAQLSFDVPGGGRVDYRLPAEVLFPVGCGVSMGPIGLMNSHEPTSPIDRLDVTAALPTKLVAGSTTKFTVTLHNPTATAIALSPCPAYVEYLESSPLANSAIRNYYLNCEGANGAIPAHDAVSFNMGIATSSVTGGARWGWALHNSDVQTGGNVVIAGR